MEQPIDNSNPLVKHFRTPELLLSLPSRGEYYPPGTLEMLETMEVEVFPMTAKDEILLNTPDALMSGIATKKVIESCIPAIKNGFEIPTTDIDAILIAIRIATYGEMMNFINQCPSCGEENNYGIDLRDILAKQTYIDFSIPHTLGSMQVYFRPQLFREVNKLNMRSFEEEKLLQSLEDSNISEDEKKERISQSLSAISNIAVDITSNFIDKVVLNDGTEVTNETHIFEFIQNCDKKMYDAIEEVIEGYRKQATIDNLLVQCAECGHKYETPLEFEASNFFG